MQKLITWNVNSIRTRFERIVGVLARHQPDVVCLQETKSPNDRFPTEAFAEYGYQSLVHGQKGFNGVALLSRVEAINPQLGFSADPISEEARVVSADFGDVSVICVYVVNGQSTDSDKYPLKLDWLDALTRWIRSHYQPSASLIVAGDFNITPHDRDVYRPELWRGKVLCSPAERKRLQALYDWGLIDLLRTHTDADDVYSWWDYRHGAYRRNHGLRIDLILGTQIMAQRCVSVEVDRQERGDNAGPGKPSDHAPVIATFR